MPRHPARFRGVRAVAGLTLAVALGAGGITGCTGDTAPDPPTRTTTPRPPTAEELAQAAAVARTRALLDTALRTRARTAADRALLRAVVAGHRTQLAALGASGTTSPPDATSPPGSASSPGGTPAPSGTTSPAGASPATTSLASLARQEYDAARETLGAVQAVEPGLATLLARQAASLAVNGDLVSRAAKSPSRGLLTPDVSARPPGPESPEVAGATTAGPTAGGPTSGGPASGGPTGGERSVSPDQGGSTESGTSGGTVTPGRADGLSTAALDGLSQELAGEHAAVYGFALLAGRSRGAAKGRALEAYATHVRLRDALERALLDAGADPPVASSAYDVGPPPSTPVAVSALATSVETALTSIASQSVGVTEGQTRADAASRLVEAARRSASWTRRPVALPGEGVTRPSEETGSGTGSGTGAADPTAAPTTTG